MIHPTSSSPCLSASHLPVRSSGSSLYYTPSNSFILPRSEIHFGHMPLPTSPALCTVEITTTTGDCRCHSGIPFDRQQTSTCPRGMTLETGQPHPCRLPAEAPVGPIPDQTVREVCNRSILD
ncbi:hypothetical protein FBUS_07724 [Fasciolopsis buskii]|uniref:Uncharacterized protein n=1 Tax=Fasciolopsis buskii TaxID=27845 RepID=A0A8E0RYI4_9TREM|nr:hypothetical protein FBUS_07724 [Fasciolopsis buski]